MRIPVANSSTNGSQGEPKDHRILIFLPFPLTEESLQHIRDEFPGISVSAYQVPWRSTKPPAEVSAEELANATILVTGSVLPAKEQVPKIRYIQLASAGANHILDHPLFTETDILFCTANGVHGYVILRAVHRRVCIS